MNHQSPQILVQPPVTGRYGFEGALNAEGQNRQDLTN
jgi:hypothetical protein